MNTIIALEDVTRQPEEATSVTAPTELAPSNRPSGLASADLLATLGHEMRTPLATLRVTLELLAELPSLSPEDAASLIGRLNRGVSWLEGLVDNLTTWSLVKEGQLVMQCTPTSLEVCVERAVGLVQPLLERKQQEVRMSRGQTTTWVHADPRWLGQALVNLLANASAYSGVGEPIDVAISTHGELAEVRVRDRGPGISPAESARLFGRFVRGPVGRRERAGGMGLGLHLVRELVSLHGGTVGVRSTPGRGSTFWVRLPQQARTTSRAS